MSDAIRRILSWVLIPLLVALPLALFASYAALQHNPQGEFCAYVAHAASANYMHEGMACDIQGGALGLVLGSWLFVQVLIGTVARVVLSAFRGAK
ncbi:hypothetical protein [Polaromonas sp.]|uniref:hypothetical protein n=1 Tax=Polaromonas sp. TaxID=1869339 RepID=UPI0032659936